MPKRSAHPGVRLTRPSGEHKRWRARWFDPDVGKLVHRALPATVTTQEARRQWAIDLSRRLVHRAEELKAGAYRAEPHAIASAVAAWEKSIEHLAANTRRGHRVDTRRFEKWCKLHAIAKTTDLTRGRLRALRDAIIARRLADGSAQSTWTINDSLKKTGTMLNYFADRDMLGVSDRDIRRACKPLPQAIERVEFYSVADIAKLPLQHSLVRAALLTGARIGELTALEWAQVDLEAEEIHVLKSKTRRARTIRLDVCPSLVAVLAAVPAAKRTGRVWPLSPQQLFRRAGAWGVEWQKCRRTCATFSCALSTLGPWQSAKRLGHSVAVAERHYAGLVRVAPDVATLEAAMGIDSHKLL